MNIILDNLDYYINRMYHITKYDEYPSCDGFPECSHCKKKFYKYREKSIHLRMRLISNGIKWDTLPIPCRYEVPNDVRVWDGTFASYLTSRYIRRITKQYPCIQIYLIKYGISREHIKEIHDGSKEFRKRRHKIAEDRRIILESILPKDCIRHISHYLPFYEYDRNIIFIE